MKIKGKLIKILKQESGVSKAGKDWKKQSFILNTGSEYNNEICVSTFGDIMNQLQKLEVGSDLECYLNVSSKEYNGKYYHNISAWRIELVKTENVESEEMPF